MFALKIALGIIGCLSLLVGWCSLIIAMFKDFGKKQDIMQRRYIIGFVCGVFAFGLMAIALELLP